MAELVTILIPTFNRASFLRESIRSALDQTYERLEIIVLDDCSNDETPSVAAEFGSDDRLKYVRNDVNLGIVGNWQKGFRLAKGSFLTILHDDDRFETTFIEELLCILVNNPSLDLCFSDHSVMNEGGDTCAHLTEQFAYKFSRRDLPPGPLIDFAKSSLVDLSLPVGATLFRTSCLAEAEFPLEAAGQVDIWLFYQLTQRNASAYFLKKPLMKYRVHEGGMSGSMVDYCLLGAIFRCRAILAERRLEAIHAPIKLQISGYLRSHAKHMLLNKRYTQAVSTAITALKYKFDVKNVAVVVTVLTGPVARAIFRARINRAS